MIVKPFFPMFSFQKIRHSGGFWDNMGDVVLSKESFHFSSDKEVMGDETRRGIFEETSPGGSGYPPDEGRSPCR
jgi:hypothetical protein